VPQDIPEVRLDAAGGNLALSHVLKQAGLTSSTSEAIRMVEQGGVKLNGEKVSDRLMTFTGGEQIVLQVGKRKFARVTIT
jgi:tyrosyl-tRNA synthetase